MARSITRVSFLQALSFGSVGAVFPFLALELNRSGLDTWQLFFALTAAPVLRLIGAPLWGWLADRSGGTRRSLLIAAGVATLGAILLTGTTDWALVGAAVVFAVGRSGAGPLVEAVSIAAVDRDPGRYGAIRRWGSIGFMLTVVLCTIGRDSLDLSPLWAGAVLATGLFILISASPSTASEAQPPLRERPPLNDWVIWAVLSVSGLHFAGVALYDSFFMVHLSNLGFGTVWFGLAVFLGITTEIIILTIGGRLIQGLGARWLLVAAVVLFIPRWLVTALGSELWHLIPIQATHGIGFGAYWLASIALLNERIPERFNASTQGLLAASAGGVGALLGNAIGSPIVKMGDSSWLFWSATALSVVATLIALAVAIFATPTPSDQLPISVERKK